MKFEPEDDKTKKRAGEIQENEMRGKLSGSSRSRGITFFMQSDLIIERSDPVYTVSFVPHAFRSENRCENHVRRLRTFFTVVLEPNIHTFSVLSETLPDFLKSKLC